ncbi:hypothetical protein Y027_5611 [Burkholderia pseudomallei TSV5]|nr:hypothetical protein Y027_5611 [Burkholderia pseudomallei TSV5]
MRVKSSLCIIPPIHPPRNAPTPAAQSATTSDGVTSENSATPKIAPATAPIVVPCLACCIASRGRVAACWARDRRSDHRGACWPRGLTKNRLTSSATKPLSRSRWVAASAARCVVKRAATINDMAPS